jgi:hypothetical protein
MRRRRKTRRPAGKGRRNLVIFGLVLTGLAGLILFVGLSDRTPKPIMPPESPETTKKRESREHNAFYATWEAAKLVPPVPKKLLLPTKLGPDSNETYYAEPGSIGGLLGIHRPDDDPAIGLYLFTCSPAIERLRESLSQDYFLYPRIGTPYEEWTWDGVDYGRALGSLRDILIATMRHTATVPKLHEQCAALLAEALQFCERIGEDGGVFHYLIASSHLATVMESGGKAARYVASPATLREMRAAVQAVRFHERPLTPYLEFRWRSLDNMTTALASGTYYQRYSIRDRLVAWWALSRQCRLIRNHKEELLSIVARPLAEHRVDEAALQHLRGGWRFPYGSLDEARQLLNNRARVAYSRDVSALLISLELFQREHGAYPDSLEALVPEYIEALPASTGGRGPLMYERDGDDYWLYAGPESEEHKAALRRMEPHKRQQRVIHSPERLNEED